MEYTRITLMARVLPSIMVLVSPPKANSVFKEMEIASDFGRIPRAPQILRSARQSFLRVSSWRTYSVRTLAASESGTSVLEGTHCVQVFYEPCRIVVVEILNVGIEILSLKNGYKSVEELGRTPVQCADLFEGSGSETKQVSSECTDEHARILVRREMLEGVVGENLNGRDPYMYLLTESPPSTRVCTGHQKRCPRED